MIEGAIGLRPRAFASQTILVLAGLILITAAVRIPLLNVPFERDEGEYAYIAWRLGHNELPYRDWVDQKPPAIFWVYRAALTLPLEPIRAVHFAALLFAAASGCALFLLARRLMNQFWAFMAAALFTLLSADPFAQGTAANTEVFMLLPLILAQIAFLKVADNPRNVLLIIVCGALTGIAIVKTAYDMYPDDFKWKDPPYEYEYDRNPFDLIAGTSKVREAIERGDNVASIGRSWIEPLANFNQLRTEFLLY